MISTLRVIFSLLHLGTFLYVLAALTLFIYYLSFTCVSFPCSQLYQPLNSFSIHVVGFPRASFSPLRHIFYRRFHIFIRISMCVCVCVWYRDDKRRCDEPMCGIHIVNTFRNICLQSIIRSIDQPTSLDTYPLPRASTAANRI